MELIINEDNLDISEVQEVNSKVRAILFDENNQILIANYGNIILLPGGKIDNDETNIQAIIRELKEETGREYTKEELTLFLTLNYYQKNYPKRNGINQNRLIQTYYFIGEYKSIEKESQKLTEREQKDNFNLELVSLETLEIKIQNNINNNPRNIYFQKELLAVLKKYKNLEEKEIIKKLKK